MERKNLEQVKALIGQIADGNYRLPTEEQVENMRALTGVEWDVEDLQMSCCEYWSHHSLEETAYFMFYSSYPPVHETELVFWKYKSGVIMEDAMVYESYQLGKGTLKALETLPIEAIIQKVKNTLIGWEENTDAGDDSDSFRFDCLEQVDYWTDTHFWIFPYGNGADTQEEIQLICFSCHNMNELQINDILVCMEEFQCPLHIREEKNI